MNILHVNLASGFRGGERQTVILIEELSKLGLTQALVCKRDSPLREHLKEIKGLTFLDSSSFISGHLHHFKADMAHAHEAKAVHWCLIHKLITKTPYVITRRIDKPLKRKLSINLAYKNASARVAISNVIKKLLEERGLGKVVIIPSANSKFDIDHTVSSQLRNLFKGKFIVGHAGALVDKHKGQKVLIDAIKIINPKIKNIEFIFLGQGKDEADLKNYSAGISNIHWLGFKDNIVDYLAALDVFAFPSRNEGLGSTLLDVIDCGVPIVATDVGGIPDIVINRETGLLIPNGDSVLLAESIIELYQSQVLRENLTLQAKNHLVNFYPESMGRKYHDLYIKILNRPST